METTARNIEALYMKFKEYADTSIELYKLNAIDAASDVLSSLVSRIVFILVFALFTLFINITISLLIGNLLGAYYWGFLIVSGFYLILMIFLHYYHGKLIKIPVTNLILEKLLKSRRTEFNKPNLAENEN